MENTGIKTDKDELHQLPMHFTNSNEIKVMEIMDPKRNNRKVREGVNEGGGEEMRFNMMTVQEVAAYLRISRFSVYNMVKKGELPAMKVLNKFRFNLKNIEQYLNKHTIHAE